MTIKTNNNNKRAEASAPEVISIYTTSNINYNTYLMLSPLFKALIVSTNNNGKYALKVTDEKNSFYFYYSELNLNIKVPLTALFNVNSKTIGILGIKWASAIDCPSRKRNLCQLSDTEQCYAVSGEKQGSKKPYNFLMGMGSYLNSLLCINYWNQFYNSAEVQIIFFKYCTYYKVDTLRFNLSGDFKGLQDIKILDILASSGLKLTGYTARDDLKDALFEVINKHDNIILNGSNIMYNNRFEATDNIYQYLTAQHRCKGGCLVNGCLKCYKLKNIVITVLIHGSKVGTTLNTSVNRAFIVWAYQLNGFNIKPDDLKKTKDLFKAVTKLTDFNKVPEVFKKTNKNGVTTFKNHTSVIRYIEYLIKTSGAEASNFKEWMW